MKEKILLIEDEKPIRKMLSINLESEGYTVLEADSGKEGVQVCARNLPDLVLLDLMLPDMQGQEVLRMLREFTVVPVIVLSAVSSEKSKIELLDRGADDYLTKPFSPGELLARVRVGLRHAQSSKTESVLEAGPIRLDPSDRTVQIRGNQIHLTPTEFAILALLLQYAGKTVTREILIQTIWGSNENETGSLRVHINQLRKKIETSAAMPELILNEPGVGYRLAV
ncbi:MAG TPA: response regulator transcription factor [Leptospiraceae bacterium]|nr:response regulator transcription factor [Leptospiraceae bacterium]HMX57258.1 response regulator transcription factor [Leptospiraceae bacterium]HMY44469.1 response regulator transcription factor [Leptospiraceae bacterium]HNE22583.1 response regulator transcription factor [Leptospiraceae bacterium]HNJ35587.1 response regulator transcription factor [Leptospiraceae bacterium]